MPCLGHVQSLHLGMCASISRTGVMALVPCLPKLRYLNLSAVGGWKGANDTIFKIPESSANGTRPDLSVRLKIEYGAPLPWRAKVIHWFLIIVAYPPLLLRCSLLL